MDKMEAQIQALETKFDSFVKTCDDLKAKVDVLQREKEDGAVKVKALENEHNDLRVRFDALDREREYEDLPAKVDDLEGALEEYGAGLESQYDNLPGKIHGLEKTFEEDTGGLRVRLESLEKERLAFQVTYAGLPDVVELLEYECFVTKEIERKEFSKELKSLRNSHQQKIDGTETRYEKLSSEFKALGLKFEALKRDGTPEIVATKALLCSAASQRLLSLPPEIRNMIYRLALVEPHEGYLKCYYDIYHSTESKLYVPRSVPLQLFQVCRQINNEASSLFYGENVFAIAEQNRASNALGLNNRVQTRRLIDMSRVQKLHITNRGCRWLSNPSRSSPGVYRESSKHHISAFAKAIGSNGHQLRYLLIDCLSGFGATDRMVMNIFKPLHMLLATAVLVGMSHVHIVSKDPDHYLHIRYLEKGMVDRSVLPFGIGHASWYRFKESMVNEKDMKNEQAGNELAAFMKLGACYTAGDATGK